MIQACFVNVSAVCFPKQIIKKIKFLCLHLVSSQIPHIFIIKLDILSYLSTSIVHKNIYTLKQSLCNILNRQKIGGNIANEHYQSKLMFSGDIDLNPGPILCNSFQNNIPTKAVINYM